MTARIVRLGSPRSVGEGLRIGTVRRPPRGVPKTEFASGDWYRAPGNTRPLPQVSNAKSSRFHSDSARPTIISATSARLM